MAERKKKPRYSEETTWFPECYIGWIGIGNCGQKTSNGKYAQHDELDLNISEKAKDTHSIKGHTLGGLESPQFEILQTQA